MRLISLLLILGLTGCASRYDTYISAWESKSSVEQVAMDQAGCTSKIYQRLQTMPQSQKVDELLMSWNSLNSTSFLDLTKTERRQKATQLCQEILLVAQ